MKTGRVTTTSPQVPGIPCGRIRRAAKRAGYVPSSAIQLRLGPQPEETIWEHGEGWRHEVRAQQVSDAAFKPLFSTTSPLNTDAASKPSAFLHQLQHSCFSRGHAQIRAALVPVSLAHKSLKRKNATAVYPHAHWEPPFHIAALK